MPNWDELCRTLIGENAGQTRESDQDAGLIPTEKEKKQEGAVGKVL